MMQLVKCRCMAKKETPMQILQELIHIHHDRTAEYQQALSTLVRTDKMDLQPIFGELIRESAECQQELQESLADLEGAARVSNSEQVGTVYKVWAKARPMIRGENNKSILVSCEQEIDAVRHAYETALSQFEGVDEVIRDRMTHQMKDMQSFEARIREYHDAL